MDSSLKSLIIRLPFPMTLAFFIFLMINFVFLIIIVKSFEKFELKFGFLVLCSFIAMSIKQ